MRSPATSKPDRADVAELVDALDLGSSAARRESSSLSFRTIHYLFILNDIMHIIHVLKLGITTCK